MLIIGRAKEINYLKEVSTAPSAQFLAVYGRRRVGKTYLIRNFFKDRADIFFYVTGIKDQPNSTQLMLFHSELERCFGEHIPPSGFSSWMEAFQYLTDSIQKAITTKRQKSSQKIVIFLDELPWLASSRSDLIPALDHAWNSQLSSIPEVTLIVCGSAASWIIKNIIETKGGLHNRLTGILRILPFSLKETEEYLTSHGFSLNHRQIAELYLGFGGVPYYLSLIPKGASATQAIGKLCFGGGQLHDEFRKLFSSLFEKSERHEQFVRVLAKNRGGISRKELFEGSKIPVGESSVKVLKELVEAGFIEALIPYGKKKRDQIYRLIDEFSFFWLRWGELAPQRLLSENGIKYWSLQSRTPAYRAWAGYSFESLCLKHFSALKESLGIGAVATTAGPWRYLAPKGVAEKGAQIDLVIERADKVTTLCEMKWCENPFKITQEFIDELKRKQSLFVEKTGTRYYTHWALITTEKIDIPARFQDTLTSIVTLEQLFK